MYEAPISPRPSTRVPLDTTATILERQVNSKDSASLSLIRKQITALTPGVCKQRINHERL